MRDLLIRRLFAVEIIIDYGHTAIVLIKQKFNNMNNNPQVCSEE